MLYIGWVKVDGETVYTAQPSETADDAEPASPATSSESADPDTEAMPAEVRLSKDDPDFQTRKQALKEAGYQFDGQAKVWRLPEDTAA